MELNREGMNHVAGYASQGLYKPDRMPTNLCLQGNGE